MALFNLNTDFTWTPFLNKRPLLNFLMHWAAWLLLHFITYIPTFVNSAKINEEYFIYAHLVIPTISFLLFYIVAFFIMPHMAILHKKGFWLVVASLLMAILFTYLKFYLEIYYAENVMQKTPALNKSLGKSSAETIGILSNGFRNYFQFNILTNVSIIVLAFAYRLALIWYQQEKIRKELENQKLRAELSYLKMQVNPHFLFNALNNIYSLAITEKSTKTGNSIMKLAELMRYVIYEKEDKENRVKLDNEIKHINDYIDLEKLRHEGDINLNFSIEGDIYDKRIAPLLLFPLIENAFKHGILYIPEKPVQIEMKVTDQYLDFYIQNFKNNYQKDKDGGIGIPNVRKRLDLLYKNSYKLDVKETEDQFFVNLHLPL